MHVENTRLEHQEAGMELTGQVPEHPGFVSQAQGLGLYFTESGSPEEDSAGEGCDRIRLLEPSPAEN